MSRGEADGLDLNYAHGFAEHTLDFLDEGWGVRRLSVLHRGVEDLSPIGRLGETLECLSIQAAPPAELDLALLPRLRTLFATWSIIGATLGEAADLRELRTHRFGEADLHAIRDHVELTSLSVKDAPYLKSLDGIGNLPGLEVLRVPGAPRLEDIGEVMKLGATLREFWLEESRPVDAIDDVEPLVNLHVLGVSECGEIESLAPILSLRKLEQLYVWGTTRIVDGDLTPIAQLPDLKTLRMQDRRHYRPRVAELKASLGIE